MNNKNISHAVNECGVLIKKCGFVSKTQRDFFFFRFFYSLYFSEYLVD